MDTERRIFYMLMLIVCFFCVWALIGAFVSVSTQSDCLAMGYPDVRVTYTFEAYCVGYEGAVSPVVERQP